MFGIIADFFASIATILFPIFASYKALRTSDPAQLTPWLIYWVILSLILLVESWTVFIIGWLPFYSWFRLFALSYLVLPQTQGAKLLYSSYVEPFIASHERQIEVFIGDLHDKGSRAGLGYLKQIVDLIRERLLNLPPMRDQTAPTWASSNTRAGYAQSLLSRFAMPSANTTSTSDFYNMLSSAVTASTSSTTRSAPISGSSNSNINNNSTHPLIPANIQTPADKRSFLASQRDKLAVLIKALDREQMDVDLAYNNNSTAADNTNSPYSRGFGTDTRSTDPEPFQVGSSPMKKNRSDNSFQNIEHDELDDQNHSDSHDQGQIPTASFRPSNERQASASRRNVSNSSSGGGGGVWNPTTWFGGAGAGAGVEEDTSRAANDNNNNNSNKRNDDYNMSDVTQEVRDAVRGISSSIDRGY